MVIRHIPLKSYQRKTVLRGHEIHSSLIIHGVGLEYNKLDWNITDINAINFITCIRQ